MPFDNRKQHVPPLFCEIINNYNQRKDLTKDKILAIEIAGKLRSLQENSNALISAAEDFIRKAKSYGKVR